MVEEKIPAIVSLPLVQSCPVSSTKCRIPTVRIETLVTGNGRAFSLTAINKQNCQRWNSDSDDLDEVEAQGWDQFTEKVVMEPYVEIATFNICISSTNQIKMVFSYAILCLKIWLHSLH